MSEEGAAKDGAASTSEAKPSKSEPKKSEESRDRMEDKKKEPEKEKEKDSDRDKSKDRSKDKGKDGKEGDRERSRARERREKTDRLEISGRMTSSQDPTLMKSRIFIGNLAVDKVSRGDLHRVFEKYGEILGISIHRNFAFVQFGKEEHANEAIKKEHQRLMGGIRVGESVCSLFFFAFSGHSSR